MRGRKAPFNQPFLSHLTATGEDELDSPQKRSEFRTELADGLSKALRIYLIIFIVEIAFLFVVSSLPFLPGEQAFFTAQGNQIGSEFQGESLLAVFTGIFINNFRISLLDLIPGFGVLIFAFSTYATARVLEALALTQNASPLVVLVLLLLLFPHSYLELPAYAIAAGATVLLIVAATKWLTATEKSEVNIFVELAQFGVSLAIIVVMLLVAALFESVEIQLGSSLFLITWIPFAAIVVGAYLLYARLEKFRKESRAELPSEPKKDDSSHLSV